MTVYDWEHDDIEARNEARFLGLGEPRDAVEADAAVEPYRIHWEDSSARSFASGTFIVMAADADDAEWRARRELRAGQRIDRIEFVG